MTFDDYTARLAALGRAVNPDTLAATRALVAPLLDGAPFPDVAIGRDLAYGPDERQRLDLFQPAGDGGGKRPLLVFVHGGGFIAGDKYTPGTPFYDNIGAWAVRRGFDAANLTYRLAPAHQWPSGIEDLRLALGWLRSRAGELGIAGDRIFLMGQSAGAAHAAAYVAHPGIYGHAPHGLAGLILLSGMYDFTSMELSPPERAYLGEDAAVYAERSSLAGLLEAGVPLLVTLAEFDPPSFEAQGLQLLQAWQRRHGSLPWFVHLLGQNHLSGVLWLGLEGDLLGPQLERFMRDRP